MYEIAQENSQPVKAAQEKKEDTNGEESGSYNEHLLDKEPAEEKKKAAVEKPTEVSKPVK